MRINYASALSWVRWAAIGLAVFVITTLAGGFILQLCADANWYKHPWATVASVIAILQLITNSALFHWLGGAAIGFAVGIWLE
jgi:hypothetical protein